MLHALRKFGALANHLHDYFSEVPIDWFEVVVQPPFATNARLLYDRFGTHGHPGN